MAMFGCNILTGQLVFCNLGLSRLVRAVSVSRLEAVLGAVIILKYGDSFSFRHDVSQNLAFNGCTQILVANMALYEDQMTADPIKSETVRG